MNRLVRLLSLGCVLAIVVLLGRSLRTQAAPSLTNVCGTISSDATWTPAGNPYAVCVGGATVASGVTLTIEPGVVVQFDSDSRLTTRGTLTALGTASQPITFTGAVASPGSWRGVLMESLVFTPTTMTLEHVTFEYGGLNTTSGAQIFVYANATLTMTHSLLRDGAGAGIYVGSDAYVSVHDTQFLNHGHQAMYLSQPVQGTDLGGLSASGNSRDVVYVDSTTYLEGEQVWPDAGLPYVVNGLFGNFQGHSLSLAPGTELRFTDLGRLYVRGSFQAIGLPDEPITLTGDVATPGYWDGLWLYGLTQPATAQLDYVTVEYGGRGISQGANVWVDYGNLVARNSIIRYSQHDGVRFGSYGSGIIINSQVVSNTQYGVRNSVSSRFVLASNNWWGHPSGPTPDTPGCGSGQGDSVTDGVLFRPVLTGTVPAPFPLTDAPSLTLTPRRWFAPADGVSKVYFDITVRDGDGQPLPGRVVNLASSLGAVTDGGLTDLNGHTLAYVVSGSAGTAEVRAAVNHTACEGALSPTSQVTFNPPVDVTELFPDSPASYFDGNFTVSPRPVVQGVLTTLSAKLTNPLTVPITVDVSFGFVQAGIGLAFGSIGDQIGQVIPANSSRVFTASFVPPVSGHVCVEVTYTITGVGGGAGGGQQLLAGGSGRRQTNVTVYQGGTGSPDKGDMLDRTGKALDFMSNFIGTAFDTDPFDIPLELANRLILMQMSAASIIANALQGDPPRQDYNQLSTPLPLVPAPVQPGGDITPARADALNDLAEALAGVNAAGTAAMIALDRAGGASEAGNLHWASLQQAAVIEYNRVMGTALITAAAAIDNVIGVAASEGITQVLISTTDVISAQQALASGFTPDHVAEAASVGLSEADLEAWRQRVLAARPEDLAGDLMPRLLLLRDRFLQLSNVLLNPVAFRPGHGVTGGAGQQLAAATNSGNTMVQLYNTTATLQLANPLTTTALIDVQPRRLDLPADWTVSVYPAQVSLEPGEQITVSVTIGAGSPLPQGSQPTVAVEGYAGSQLLGGVVIQVLAPNYFFFDGALHLYLPQITN